MSERSKRTNLFEIDHFRTGPIKMPGLDFVVNFNPGQCYFRYDGPVPSLEDYIASLPERLTEKLEGVDFSQKGGFNSGYYMFNPPMKGFLMVIKNISPRANISNEGHEAAEILVRLGLTGELEMGLRGLGFGIPIADLELHEAGVVGAFVAAKIHGYDVVDLYREQDPEGLVTLRRLGLVI